MFGLLVALALTPSTMNAPDLLGKLQFMTGRWEATRAGGVTEETWSAPRSGSMQGMSRTMRDGTTRFTEYLSIEVRGEKLRMTMAQKLGGPSLEFDSVSVSDRDVVFQAVNDPNNAKITYRRDGDVLLAQVAGVRDGTPYTLDFKFEKAK